jgi:uncharacterized protein (DUF924 family)
MVRRATRFALKKGHCDINRARRCHRVLARIPTPRSGSAAVALFEALGDKRALDDAKRPAGLIARFGRFLHRNAVMGRISTPQEIAYRAQGGFAG